MSDTILLIVRHLDDLEPARAIIGALPERKFALSFASEDLRTRFGETAHASSTDALEYVLKVEQIAIALCFAGARELGPNSNFLLLSYFEELGVPTVELQRDLLRDPELAQKESSAGHYLAWSGAAGTGYLKQETEVAELGSHASSARAVRDDVVLVTSHLAGSAYSEEQRFQFAFGVMRLAREHPQLCFLWRISNREEQNADAKLLLAMLSSSGPRNLWLEENEPLDALLARASAVVTMAQTALLDYAAAKKPTLVYVTDDVQARLAELSLTRFARPDELLSAWRALRAEPARFGIESRVPRLSSATLRVTLTRIEQTRALRPDRREIMLRYLAQMQDVRARADLGRLNPQLGALERRVGELEKLLIAQRDKLASESRKLAESKKNGRTPLGVAKRALKLARAVQKRAFKG